MAGDRGGSASIRPPQRLQDRRGWIGQGSRYLLESPEAVTTMLKRNCRPCSHVVDAAQVSLPGGGELRKLLFDKNDLDRLIDRSKYPAR